MSGRWWENGGWRGWRKKPHGSVRPERDVPDEDASDAELLARWDEGEPVDDGSVVIAETVHGPVVYVPPDGSVDGSVHGSVETPDGSVHGSVDGSAREGPRIGDGSVTDRSHGSVDGSVTDRSTPPDGSVGRIGERDGSDRMAERQATVCRGWSFEGPVIPQPFPLFLIVKRAGEPDRRMLVVGWRPALVQWAPAGAEDVWLPVAVTVEGGAMGPKQLGPPIPGESWDFAS